MQHDLFLSGHDVDLRSNFQDYFLRINHSSFDAFRQEEHDAGEMNVLPLLSQGFLHFYFVKRLFLEFLLSGGQSIDLRSILRSSQRKALKELSNIFFCDARSSSGFQIPSYVPICRKMLKKAKFGIWWPLVIWTLTWPKKWPKRFVMILNALWNAAMDASFELRTYKYI